MARTTLESRIRSSLILAGDLAHYGEELTAGLKKRLGGPFPDQQPTFERLAEALMAARETLLERDEEHQEQILEGRRLRAERHRLCGELRTVLVRVRGTLSGLWGPERAEDFLKLDDRTSYDPLILATQGRWVRDRLEGADIQELNTDFFRSRLGELSTALDEAIREVLKAHRRQKNTRIARAEAARALDGVHVPARKALLAFSELAGLENAAQWLKLEASAVGRPRRTKAAPPTSLTLPLLPVEAPAAIFSEAHEADLAQA